MPRARHLARMSLIPTLALLVAAIALAVFAGWRGSRPWEPSRGVRMAPWRLIMLLCGAVVFILVIHLGTLMGVPQRPY
jgi:hypothetical protein